jgi:uncharacterized protein (DUF1501 family)
MPDHCSDFSRSQLLSRTATAVAGAGLPAIERGMPLPAGTGLTRRSMLLRSAGVALTVFGAGRALGVDAFEEGIARAAAIPEQPVLVSIFMPGGADSLALLAPTADPRYAKLRPTLAQSPAAGVAFGEDDRLRWHPGARRLAELHAAGKVSVLPGVGYAGPNQSHFTSRHFWEVGELDTGARTGWLGRYLDEVGDADNPIQGLALDVTLSPALASASAPVAAASKPSTYAFRAPGVYSNNTGPMQRAFGELGGLGTADPTLRYARSAQRNAAGLAAQLATPLTASGVTYPGTWYGERLAGLAGLLHAGLPIRCAAVNAPPRFDTHASQAGTFDQALTETLDGVAAFQADLEARGVADRVLTVLWSEFGRRAAENGSRGTDHGAAGCAFVIGSRAAGEMVGEFPGLDRLDHHGNLVATSDFRALYCSLLEQWMGFDAARIIPGADAYARPVLVR